MAVLSVREVRKQRSGKLGEKFTREYTRVFHVETSDVEDGPATVMFDRRLPKPYSSYRSGNDSDPSALMYDMTPTLTERPTMWEVVCKYKTYALGGSEPPPDDNPLNQPTIWSGNWEVKEAVLTQDLGTTTGGPVVNSAYQKFTNPIMVEAPLVAFSARRNEVRIPDTFYTYRRSMNSDTVTMRGRKFKPKTLRLKEMRYNDAFYGNQRYVQMQYDFLYSEGEPFTPQGGAQANSGHDIIVDDVGRMQLVGGLLKACVDKNKQPVSDDVGLNSDGTQASATADIKQKKFQGYYSKPYAIFKL